MTFYIIFTKLPFHYSKIKTSNATNAIKTAKQYRKDSVVINPHDKWFTFGDAIEFSNKWKEVNLLDVEDKNHYRVYDINPNAKGLVAIESTERTITINDRNILGWAKKETGRNGVIWIKDEKGIVFGVKKGNFTQPLLLFVSFKPQLIK